MRGVLKPIESAGWAGIVAAKAVAFFPSVFARPTGRADLVRQLYATGIRTLPVITVVSLFMGMILALQVGLELARFNQEVLLGAAVMMTLLREMGSFFACRAVSFVLDIGIMWLTVDVLAWPNMLMKIVSNVIIIIVNYVASKLLIFNKGKESGK